MPSKPNSLYRKLFPTAHRILVEKVIRRELPKLKGRILVIGAGSNPYGSFLDASAQVVVTDIRDDFGVIDQIVDAHDMPFDDSFFDAVLAIEVVEHLADPAMAIREFHRVLRCGGRAIISIPFMFHIHADPEDYQRFTQSGIRKICQKFSNITIIPIGGRGAVISDLLTTGGLKLTRGFRLINNLFRIPVFCNGSSSDSPSGYWINAQK
jgi:SAM-dependent methyltransferase